MIFLGVHSCSSTSPWKIFKPTYGFKNIAYVKFSEFQDSSAKLKNYLK